jgi:hypothetical protein
MILDLADLLLRLVMSQQTCIPLDFTIPDPAKEFFPLFHPTGRCADTHLKSRKSAAIFLIKKIRLPEGFCNGWKD